MQGVRVRVLSTYSSRLRRSLSRSPTRAFISGPRVHTLMLSSLARVANVMPWTSGSSNHSPTHAKQSSSHRRLITPLPLRTLMIQEPPFAGRRGRGKERDNSGHVSDRHMETIGGEQPMRVSDATPASSAVTRLKPARAGIGFALAPLHLPVCLLVVLTECLPRRQEVVAEEVEVHVARDLVRLLEECVVSPEALDGLERADLLEVLRVPAEAGLGLGLARQLAIEVERPLRLQRILGLSRHGSEDGGVGGRAGGGRGGGGGGCGGGRSDGGCGGCCCRSDGGWC